VFSCFRGSIQPGLIQRGRGTSDGTTRQLFRQAYMDTATRSVTAGCLRSCRTGQPPASARQRAAVAVCDTVA